MKMKKVNFLDDRFFILISIQVFTNHNTLKLWVNNEEVEVPADIINVHDVKDVFFGNCEGFGLIILFSRF